MKKLITICLACLCFGMFSCKKESKELKTTANVTFKFYPDNYSSTILITNLITGEVKKYENQTDSLIINTTVKVGDKLQPEMTGLARGGNEKYAIYVYFNNKLLAADRAFGTSDIKQQDIKIPLTFYAEMFK